MATLKQRRAVEALGVTGGVISKAMAVAGYAPSITHATEKLTNSDGWKELMGKHLDDKKLIKVHEEGLKAGRRIFKNNNETGEIEDMGIEPDYAVRHKYLDLAYKVKDKVKPETLPPSQTTVNINFFSNPKIQQATKSLDEAYKEVLINGDENKESIETLQNK